jgi:hypothetical protein
MSPVSRLSLSLARAHTNTPLYIYIYIYIYIYDGAIILHFSLSYRYMHKKKDGTSLLEPLCLDYISNFSRDGLVANLLHATACLILHLLHMMKNRLSMWTYFPRVQFFNIQKYHICLG